MLAQREAQPGSPAKDVYTLGWEEEPWESIPI